MTSKGVCAGVLIAAGMVFAIRGGCLNETTKAPDERLATRFDELCEIARANVGTPVRGVHKLGSYMGKHTGDILGDWGATISTIERIPDDEKHDDRARVARDRIRKPLRACERDWARFGEAVESNPEASALVERFSVRLNRTIEIIFSGMPRVKLLDLPRELDRVVQRLDAR